MGTKGKIAGKITDKASGEPLVGASILVVGTTLGAATDVDGQYTILEVPPGTYTVQVSYIGYEKILVSGVRVYIDQTARVNVALEVQAIEAGDMIVVAERRIIKPDVATSVVAVASILRDCAGFSASC